MAALWCEVTARKTPQDYQQLAAERSFEWLGPVVTNSSAKTLWRCPDGHEWEGTYRDIRAGCGCAHCVKNRRLTPELFSVLAAERNLEWRGPFVRSHEKTGWTCLACGYQWETSFSILNAGHGCPNCVNRKPVTEADHYAIAEVRGIKWLGPYVPVTQKTTWECLNGHQWQASYSTVKYKHGCPHCAVTRRRTQEEFHRLGELRGYTWLGPYTHANDPTWWECSHGHRWETAYSWIARGAGCPECARLAPPPNKFTNEDYASLAMSRGWKWLGPLPNSTQERTWWQCDKGHQFDSSYNHATARSGCPACVPPVTARKTAGDYAKLAASLNWIWLGPYPDGAGIATSWQCEHGHSFERAYSTVAYAQTCPECGHRLNGFFASSQQFDLQDMLGGEINRRVGRYGIDLALYYDGILIALEYSGWYWHQDRVDEDAARANYLIDQGWRILEIKSGRLLPTSDQLTRAIARLVSGSTYEEIVLLDWGG